MALNERKGKKQTIPRRNITLLANKPTLDESLLSSVEQAAGGIRLHVNADKT